MQNTGVEPTGEVGLTSEMPYDDFRERYPRLAEVYDEVSLACHQKGPLDARERRLVRLGIEIGRNSKGAVETEARRALEEGISPEELRHAVLMCVPTGGFPAAVSAMQWVEEVIRGFPGRAEAQAGLERVQR